MRRIEVIGNLGNDAESRVTKSGTSVLNFSVAAKGRQKDEDPIWVRCALFGKRAEALAGYLTKGTRVFVRGEASLREWESQKTGKSGTSLEISVDEVELLGGGEQAKSSGSRRPVAETADDDDPFGGL